MPAARLGHRRRPAHRPEDAIPVNMCLRCGRIGRHADSEDCIDHLRSELADLQFRLTNALNHHGAWVLEQGQKRGC
jgi:hypothetical protein